MTRRGAVRLPAPAPVRAIAVKAMFNSFNRLLPVILIGFFVVLSLAADIAPAKKFYFVYETEGMKPFFRLETTDFRGPLPLCPVTYSYSSLPYLLLLKAVHANVADRLLSLRLVSVLTGSAGLICFYLIGKSLLSRSAALVGAFFLVANPAFLETARAFGYVSLSHMTALLAFLFAVIAGRGKKWWLWVLFSAVSSYLLLYLYAPMRLATIPLIILCFVVSGKGWWRKILIYGGVFIGILIGVGFFQSRSVGLVSRILQSNYSDEYIGSETSPVVIEQLARHVKMNIPVLFGYLLNLKRTVFTTGWAPAAQNSRLFHSAYIPFWIIGLIVCGCRRRRGDIIVLLMLAFFAFSKLPSNGIWPRRMIDILYPLALLAGVGVTAAYSYLARVLSPGPRRIAALLVLCGFLLASGFFEIKHFLFELSRPQYDVPSETLSRIADFLLERLENNQMVVFPYDEHPYLVGNKYLANRLREDHLIRSAPPFPGILLRYMQWSLTTGMPLTVVYRAPISEDYSSAIAWANENFPGAIAISGIPGSDFAVFTFSPPASVSPNLIASKKPRIQLSGGPVLEPRPFAADEIYFDFVSYISFDVEIRPSREGEAPWLVFDFGMENRRIPRVLLAAPPGDAISSRPDLFIREAVISAGSDGVNWEVLGRIKGDKVTRRAFHSYQWLFPGDRPFRYYRLEFFADGGRPARSVFLDELGLYESENLLTGVSRSKRIVLCDG